MPVKEAEEGICNLYNLHNSSQGRHLSQAVGGNWRVPDHIQWVEKPTQSGALLNFNLKNYSFQQLDSVRGSDVDSLYVPFNQNHMQLTPGLELSSSLTINNPLNVNEFFLGRQDFQSKQHQPGIFSENTGYDQRSLTSRGISTFTSHAENECADSPTLTANSERSEITEASSDFTILKGQHQFERDQQVNVLHTYPMQQPGYNDMSLLQQHMLFKQLQEYHRHQQLQQQNSLNQFSTISRQGPAGAQFSTLINGTPVHEATQMHRNWMPRGASPTGQGVSNKITFSQEQGPTLHSVGLAPQQHDVSLYGTPISNTRGNMAQFPHLQGLSHDSVNMLAKASGQTQKLMLPSSGLGNPYLGDHSSVPLDLVGLPQGGLVSKQELQMKNNFGQVPVQGLNTGVFLGNLQEGCSPQVNTPVKEYNGRQEQAGWPSMQQTKQLGPSQGLIPLDPMEAKILYNMDDNIWDAFGSRSDTVAAGFNNSVEHPDPSYSFPSIQSGSWSALMQSAVAEASSSDTGLQEEWSGLTFQNTEHSTDNQISNFVDNEKQQTGWVDSNLQSASSFTSKPFPVITDSSMSSSFPGFQQPGIQLSVEQREDNCHDGSHESIENYNPQQKASTGDSQKVQTFMHSDTAWNGQTTDCGAVEQPNIASADVSLENKHNENMVKSQHQASNVPHVGVNPYEGAKEIHEKQQNLHQRQNSNDYSKGLGGCEEGQIDQFRFFGNVSSSAMDVDKASLPDFEGSSRASEEMPSRGDQGSNASSTFRGSVLPDGSNFSAQTSEQMLELLHKVDQSKGDSTMKQFESADGGSLAKIPGADSHEASISQLFAQSSASQGFGLRLAPPSQRMSSSNNFLSPPGLSQTMNNPSSAQVNSEIGEKNQAWPTPPSPFQSPTPSHDLTQRAHWDNRMGTLGPKSFYPYVNMQSNSIASLSPNPSQMRNPLQMPPLSNIPVSSQSSHATISAGTSRFPPFNQAPTQDISQQIHNNPANQQFPVLEASLVSQPSVTSSMPQKAENSGRPYNVWRNVPTQRQPFGTEPLKFSSNLPSSMNPSNTSLSTSWTPHGPNDKNSTKGGNESSEIGASSNQGFDIREEHHGKEMSQQRMPIKMLDASCSGGQSQGQVPVSDVSALSSRSQVSIAQQQDLDHVKNNNNLAQASSERNLESISHSNNDQNNYFLLHQVQAINNNGADNNVQWDVALGGQQLHDNISRFRHPIDGRPCPSLQPNSYPSGDPQSLSFLAELRDGSTVKPPQHVLQSKPQEMVAFSYNDSHTQSGGSNVLSNQTDCGLVNMQMASSWFKQFGAFRNGQMVSMFDPRLAKTAASQFSLGKQPQNLHINTPLERLDAADIAQGGKVWPTTAAAMVANQQSFSSFMLPSEGTPQLVNMGSKKRKISTIESLPWYKEVNQGSKRPQNISVAEQDWAQSTNRLMEKAEDEVEMIEDLQPMHRSKRRLILTTQLLQQLFRPAPASIFFRDSATNYGIIPYFVSRLSLGDACSLSCCTRNNSLASVNSANVNSEEHKLSERSDGQQYCAAVEEFIDRAKKLENDFQRLDKAASVADLRAEFQELERFAVINRFAKFHVRGQMDASGASPPSAMPRSVLQRHVVAFPMPRNLPEGVQCLSL